VEGIAMLGMATPLSVDHNMAFTLVAAACSCVFDDSTAITSLAAMHR
jgi:hypothetical protein